MKKIKVKIDGIHCDNCRASIKNALSENKKIKSINIEESSAIIKCDETLDYSEIIDKINDIGFETNKKYIEELK